MILGMSLATFTQFHVILSLIGILSGIVVLLGMLNAKHLPSTTALFLISTVASCVTGFMFPMPFDRGGRRAGQVYAFNIPNRTTMPLRTDRRDTEREGLGHPEPGTPAASQRS